MESFGILPRLYCFLCVLPLQFNFEKQLLCFKTFQIANVWISELRALSPPRLEVGSVLPADHNLLLYRPDHTPTQVLRRSISRNLTTGRISLQRVKNFFSDILIYFPVPPETHNLTIYLVLWTVDSIYCSSRTGTISPNKSGFYLPTMCCVEIIAQWDHLTILLST